MPEPVGLRHLPLVARLVVWRATLPLAKRVVPAERLVRMLASPSRRRRSTAEERAALRVAARLWRDSAGPCLERSLALYRELGRLGANPTLVLGVGADEVRVVGHAWLEVDGRVIVDSHDSTDLYAPVARFDASGVRL